MNSIISLTIGICSVQIQSDSINYDTVNMTSSNNIFQQHINQLCCITIHSRAFAGNWSCISLINTIHQEAHTLYVRNFNFTIKFASSSARPSIDELESQAPLTFLRRELLCFANSADFCLSALNTFTLIKNPSRETRKKQFFKKAHKKVGRKCNKRRN